MSDPSDLPPLPVSPTGPLPPSPESLDGVPPPSLPAPPSTPTALPQQSPPSAKSETEEPPAPPQPQPDVPRTQTKVTVATTGTAGSRSLAGSNSWLLVMERNQTLRSMRGHRRERSREFIEMQQQRRREQQRIYQETIRLKIPNMDALESTGKEETESPVEAVIPHSKSAVSFKSIKTDSRDETEIDHPKKHSRKSVFSTKFSFQRDYKPDDPLAKSGELKKLFVEHKPELADLVDPARPGPVCSFCHHSDVGYLISPCTCIHTKPVHFHCLKHSILARKSMNCLYCRELYLGVEPLYDHIANRRIMMASYRLFIILLAIIVVKYLFFVAPDYTNYFRSFFCFFSAISSLSIAMYLVLWCYKVYYNRHNQKVVDVLIEPDTVCLLV